MTVLEEMILRVEMTKRPVHDPTGPYPACRNALGTWACERCGGNVRGAEGPCPASRPEDRWRFEENTDEG